MISTSSQQLIFRNSSGKKWIARAILLAAIALLFFVLPVRTWIEKISWLHVKEINIEADLPLSESEIRRSVLLPKNTSLIFLDAESLVLRLKALTWVDQAIVKKEFPNRLFIKTTPRQISAIWIQNGSPYYVDSRGTLIERIDRRPLPHLHFPIVTQENSLGEQWSRALILEAVHRIERSLEPDFLVSELNLDSYPYFRVFLSPIPIEVTFDFETWSTQLPYMVLLLRHPPLLASQPRKINLVFPKKTIVTTQENK